MLHCLYDIFKKGLGLLVPYSRYPDTTDEIVGVKDVEIVVEQPHMYRNSRVAKVQDLYEKLPPLEQRSILKQMKALIEANSK